MSREGEEREYTLADLARACGCTPNTIRALLKRGRVPEDATPVIDLITGTRVWPADRFRRFVDWNAARMEQIPGRHEEEGAPENPELEEEPLE